MRHKACAGLSISCKRDRRLQPWSQSDFGHMQCGATDVHKSFALTHMTRPKRENRRIPELFGFTSFFLWLGFWSTPFPISIVGNWSLKQQLNETFCFDPFGHAHA